MEGGDQAPAAAAATPEPAPTPASTPAAAPASLPGSEAAAAKRSWFGFGSGKGPRAPRRHPYADELSTAEELAHDPRRVALFWLGLATGLAALGLFLGRLYSPHVPGNVGAIWWESAAEWPRGQDWGLIEIPLFAGLALLGFGFSTKPWAKRITMAGWLLFGFYWSLVAQDLFYLEHHDYINFLFAVLGTYFFTYLAYHQWLSQVRRVDSPTVHFLNVGTFVAATSYFIIDKIEPIRKWLILTVSDHTYWMLGFFGQGGTGPHRATPQNPYCTGSPTEGAGLVFCTNPEASSFSDVSGQTDLASFHYADNVYTAPRAEGFWADIMHFDPSGSSAEILPVSIILACTALQSIMLFVGLFVATPATWKKRLWASAIIAVVIYILNLLRNTGIVWFYGQGEASFWMMHDAIGKGGSLVAFVVLAFAAFAWFPEFLRALIGVLDLPYRDGPLERALRIGRRRPEPAPPASP